MSDLAIIDVDAHITEPHDLWTSRAPAAYKNRVPHVTEVDGASSWVVEDDVVIGMDTPVSVIRKDGEKSRGVEFFGWKLEDVHAASYDMVERVKVLDRFGIHAQVLYPNVAGFGNQNFMAVEDEGLRQACAQIYNDAMAEIQADSGERLLPMALMPWWNIDHCVAEVERAAGLGLRGIVMCSDPDSVGLPDLGEEAWLPFWEICEDKELPVNFHIGASETSFNMFGRAAWPSMGMRRRLALGSASLFMENSRVISNMLFSGVLDRYPGLKVVSVESGIGWIPFMLEALDYEWNETRSGDECKLSMPPSEYFRRQVYGCFWFEKVAPNKLVDAIGEDNLLFETDFPHPTCLYPDVAEYLAEITADWSETRRRKILQDNAAALYKIELPAGS
ncbi:MAG: amidohydrolase family protein [Myxococcota bacterium]|nr:amidohydrolase family protein [Myxococcota bacterium]